MDTPNRDAAKNKAFVNGKRFSLFRRQEVVLIGK